MSSRTASGPSLMHSSTTSGWQMPSPTVSVSWMWAAKLSAGDEADDARGVHHAASRRHGKLPQDSRDEESRERRQCAGYEDEPLRVLIDRGAAAEAVAPRDRTLGNERPHERRPERQQRGPREGERDQRSVVVGLGDGDRAAALRRSLPHWRQLVRERIERAAATKQVVEPPQHASEKSHVRLRLHDLITMNHDATIGPSGPRPRPRPGSGGGAFAGGGGAGPRSGWNK